MSDPIKVESVVQLAATDCVVAFVIAGAGAAAFTSGYQIFAFCLTLLWATLFVRAKRRRRPAATFQSLPNAATVQTTAMVAVRAVRRNALFELAVVLLYLPLPLSVTDFCAAFPGAVVPLAVDRLRDARRWRQEEQLANARVFSPTKRPRGKAKTPGPLYVLRNESAETNLGTAARRVGATRG